MDVKSIDFDEQLEKLGKVPRAARYGAVAAILALVAAGYYFFSYQDTAANVAVDARPIPRHVGQAPV